MSRERLIEREGRRRRGRDSRRKPKKLKRQGRGLKHSDLLKRLVSKRRPKDLVKPLRKRKRELLMQKQQKKN